VQAQKGQFVELQARALQTLEKSDEAVAQQTESLTALSSDTAELTESAQDGVLAIAETLGSALLPAAGSTTGSQDAMSGSTGVKLLTVMAAVGQASGDVQSSVDGQSPCRRTLASLSAPADVRVLAARLLYSGMTAPPPSGKAALGAHRRRLQASNATLVAAAVARARSSIARVEAAVTSVGRAVSLNVQPGEAALVVQGTGVGVSTQRSTAGSAGSTTSSGGTGFDIGGSLGSNVSASESVDLRAVAWGSNPYGWAALASSGGDGLTSRGAAVTTLTVAKSGSGEEVPVTAAATPVTLRMPVAAGTDRNSFECAFWDSGKEAWSRRGMVLVGMDQPANGTTTWTAVCASTHLTSFSADVRAPSVEINSVNPFTDAGLLANYLDPRNLFPIVVLCVLLGGFFMAWAISAMCDWRCRKDLRRLRKVHFVRFGEVRPEAGNDELHVLDEMQEAQERKKYAAKLAGALVSRGQSSKAGAAAGAGGAASGSGAAAESGRGVAEIHTQGDADRNEEEVEVVPSRTRFLRQAKRRGTFFLVVQHIALDWIDRLRRNHSWASTFASTLDEQLMMTRPQRIATLASSILVSMAVAAFFFGRDPQTIEARMLISVIAALAMVPTDRAFPWLFGKANSFRSRTVELVEKRRIPWWRRVFFGAKYKSKNVSHDGDGKAGEIRVMPEDGGGGRAEGIIEGGELRATPGAAKQTALAGGTLRDHRNAGAASDDAKASEPKSSTVVVVSATSKAGTGELATSTIMPGHDETRGVDAGNADAKDDADSTGPATEVDPASGAVVAVSRAIRSAASMDRGCAWRTVDETLALLGADRTPEGTVSGRMGAAVVGAVAVMSRSVIASAAADLAGSWSSGISGKMRSGVGSVVAEHPCIGPQITSQAKVAAEAAAVFMAADNATLRVAAKASKGVPSLFALAGEAAREAAGLLREAGRLVAAEVKQTADTAGPRRAGLHRRKSPEGSVTAKSVVQRALVELEGSGAGGDGAMVPASAGRGSTRAVDRGSFADVSRLLLLLMRRRVEGGGSASAGHLSVEDASVTEASAAGELSEAGSAATSSDPGAMSLAVGAEADLVLSGLLTHILSAPFESVCDALQGLVGRLGSAKEASRVVDAVPMPVVVPDEPGEPRVRQGSVASRAGTRAAAASDAGLAGASTGGDADASAQAGAWLADDGPVAEDALPAVRSFGAVAAPLLLAVMSLIQVWAGALAVLFGLYLSASEAFLPDKGNAGATIGVACGLGAAMVLFGGIAFSLARDMRLSLASVSLVLAVGAEAAGIAIVLTQTMPLALEAGIVVLGFQALPGIFAIVGAVLVAYVQRKLLARTRKVLSLVAAIRADDDRLAAVIRVQRAYRAFHARNRLTRLREMRTWDDLRPARRWVLGLLYACVILVSGFSFYLCLIFGVVFTPEQASAWILASLTSFAIEIIITAPLIQLVLAVVDFFRHVQERSARDVAILSLAEAKGIDVTEHYDEPSATENKAGGEAGGELGSETAKRRARATQPSIAFADLLVDPSTRRLPAHAMAQAMGRPTLPPLGGRKPLA